MSNLISGETLAMLVLFALLSIIVNAVQIRLRKKARLYDLCRVSVFIPLTSIIIRALSGMSQALVAISEANDLTPSVANMGLARLAASISLGLLITMILYIFYAVTVTICENQTD